MKLHLAIAFFAVQSLHADWVIVQKTSTGDHDKSVTTQIKDDQIRSDVGNDTTVLLNGKDGSVQMFMHAKKKSMRVNTASLKGLNSVAGKLLGGDDGKATTPKATGENVKVGEWNTEVYAWKSAVGSAKFYIAKDFPHFASLNAAMDKVSKSMSNPMSAMFPDYASLPGMVVKSEITMLSRTVSTELVSAKEEPVPDSAFQAPEGYAEMKIPAFPSGLAPK